MTDDVLAADGRVIGARAIATRRRLLDATAKLLTEQGILDLRVVDITRDIGSSPATFYQYFNDVDEAILELAKEATEDEKPLVSLLQPGWNKKTGLEQAHHFVDAYMVFGIPTMRSYALAISRPKRETATFAPCGPKQTC
jgi:AcrR family transcriptional regulator